MAAPRAVLQSVQRLVALEQRARRLAQRLRLAQAEATESHARQQLCDLLAEQQQPLPPSPSPPPPSVQSQQQRQQQRPPRAVDAAGRPPRGVAEELGRVPRSLAAALRHVERALDSDATESSSGGDTDTEEVDDDHVRDAYCADDHHHQGSRSGGGGGAWVGDPGAGAWMDRVHHHHHNHDQQQQQQHLEHPRSALRRSTAWLWARERAMVASRWTWLTAQVSDLEYRIRQHSELYRQIRFGKGPVVLGDLQAPEDVTRPHRKLPGTGAALPLAGEMGGGHVEMSACSPALLLSNLRKQSSRLKQSLGGMVCPLSQASSPQPKPSPPQLNGVLAGSTSCTRGGDCPPDGSDAAKRRPAVVSRGAPAPPSPPGSSSCVAARTRPLRELRRRRVLRASDAYFLSRKAQRPVTVRCSCEQPLSCMVCVSPYTTQQQQPMNLDTMTLPERAAVLSPSTHPVLSLPNDIPLHLHFQSLMKRAEWHERMNPKPKVPVSSSSNNSSNNNKRPTGVPRPWTASPGSPAERKQRHKPDASLPTTKCDWSKACVDPSLWQYLDSVERGPSPLDSLDTDGEDGGHFKKRRRSGHSPLAAGSKRQRGGVRSRSLTLGESPEDTAAVVTVPPLRQAYTPVPADASPAPPTLPLASAYAHTSTATPTSTQASARRRRVENSFDINNIVIPLSMAAFAHVEKIQYKEILTPGWRELGFENEGPDIEEVEEVEDVSDESFADRHARFEQMEKTRWCFWSPAIHRRTRSFNKSTSEGRCTPQPPSPDVSVSGGGSNHHTGLNAEQHRFADRSLRDSFNESTRSSTPDMCSEEFLVVQPWEKRAFPLREQEEIALAESDCNHSDERRSAPPAPAQQVHRHLSQPSTGNSEEPSAAAPPPYITERDGAAPLPREERRPAKRSLRSASARQLVGGGGHERELAPHDLSAHDGKAVELRSRSVVGGDDNNHHMPSGRTRAGDGKSRNSIVLRAARRTNSH